MHSVPTPYVPAAVVPLRVADGIQQPALAAPRTLLRTRHARICWLIFAICALSVADLHMTLTYLTSVGMSEANPVARLVMSTNSPAILIAWKLTSVAAACLAFYAGRRTLLAEIAAWFCCGVLIWLTMRWGEYSTELATICPQMYLLHQAEGGPWVTMTP